MPLDGLSLCKVHRFEQIEAALQQHRLTVPGQDMVVKRDSFHITSEFLPMHPMGNRRGLKKEKKKKKGGGGEKTEQSA